VAINSTNEASKAAGTRH